MLKAEKPPAYIRDAMDGLFEERNVYKFEASFGVLELLIRRRGVGFNDISVELVKVLLHLENRFGLDYFDGARTRCLIACCVLDPTKTVPFLTKQFYERNYSLSHRELILHVIREAAKELAEFSDELSRNSDKTAQTSHKTNLEEVELQPTPLIPTWKQIIANRIKAKTKIKHHIDKSGAKQQKLFNNRLNPVAGLFFFPLMANYDRPTEKCFDLLGRDHFLLGQLLYTLSTVLYYSQNCQIAYKMCCALMELIWTLRLHEEAFVRQGVLFSLCTVVLCLSARDILLQLNEQFEEEKFWLENVMSNDVDEECKKLASQTLLLLQTKLKEAVGSVLLSN